MPAGPDLPFHCSVSCSECSSVDSCPAPEGSVLTGWSLVRGALLAFLVPLGLAFGGSLLLIETPQGQLFGGISGLVLGMVAARQIVRRWTLSQRPTS